MLIIGTIARYHRKAPPSALHHEFTQLSLADRQRVRLLAGLLRIADALDKEHRQKIQGIVVVRKGTEVRIQASGADDVLLEQWALRKKDDLFREVFSLEVTLSRDGAGTDG
jgi:exopolyphosphatase/guanosine-5'-triphosphate,3'-diphosphate pyrophosphatase